MFAAHTGVDLIVWIPIAEIRDVTVNIQMLESTMRNAMSICKLPFSSKCHSSRSDLLANLKDGKGCGLQESNGSETANPLD
jgi:hypothetical protein